MSHHEQILLGLKGIEKTFRPDVLKPPIQSLKGVDLDFPEGLCTGLVGHNGAGKTTTIRMILGLTTPDRGSILFRGKPMSRTHRARIGYMAEAARFPTVLTPFEILRTQVALHQVHAPAGIRDLIMEKLRSVGLGNEANRPLKNFSKGMAQRLAWAHATIHDPELLILDEPFSGLDPLGRITMKNWILTEKKRGITMVLCTHELPQITSLCDHIHILRHGKLVYSTLNTEVRGAKLQDALPRFFVDVNGAQKQDLDNILNDRKLATWTSFEQEGFIIRLGFADYSAATDWLKALLAKNFVVARFADDNSATEEQLLVHFKEEFTR